MLSQLRNRHFFFLDLIFLLLAPWLALALRLDALVIPEYFHVGLLVYMVVSLLVRLPIFYQFDLYRRFWQYASVDELRQIVIAVLLSTAIVVPSFILLSSLLDIGFARSVFISDTLLVLSWVGGIRFGVRLGNRKNRLVPNEASEHTLIVGAGDAGAMLAQELRKNPHLGLIPVGFIDDDPIKHGNRIHNIPVLGGREEIDAIITKYDVQRVVIAMPTAPGKIIREITAVCERIDVPVKIVPGIYELVGGTVTINQLRDVQIEDLLRREPVQIDSQAVTRLLAGKRVLITGGGGSIGSELCRQILRCQPAHLTLLGHGENSIFEIYHELRRAGAKEGQLTAVIADIRFPDRIKSIFRKHKPEIVFHAAAHKHVPLMELNPVEAITNNVLGTRNMLAAALAVDVERFVMISTDKAVNPTSLMGASKRTAELLVHHTAQESERPYVAVRFGNVLGSRGSVVLTFQKQIASGGPVTVTDPEMVRYFMTIPEAVQLVLQAAVLGAGGEVFLLNMGDPVKIVDLARDLIELSGLEVGRDIDIVFTGCRPGEKLYEELFVDGEDYHPTQHDKIFIAGNASSFVPNDLGAKISALEMATQHNDARAIRCGLQALLPEYAPVADIQIEQPIVNGRSPSLSSSDNLVATPLPK